MPFFSENAFCRCAGHFQVNTKTQQIMKKDIHPEYRKVIFHDTSSDFKFMTRSTMNSSETMEWEDGNKYPLVKIEVSAASHPFYTGKKLYVDTAGRVEKFNRRYKKESDKS